MSDLTKLSSSTTVTRYKKLEAANDRAAISQFLVERFDERYFQPVENSTSKHGFTVLAIACLVIESLEAFYQGRPDTRNVSTQMFRDFFANHDTPLKVLAGGNDWFYKDIRCGILHQSESRGGWRILRRGPILDAQAKAINAAAILRALRDAVREYAQEQLRANGEEEAAREAERMAALELQAETGEEVELEEGESLDDLKARMGKLKPKKASIPADLLNNANSYDDKVALIRMIVSDNSGRVASVMRNMIES